MKVIQSDIDVPILSLSCSYYCRIGCIKINTRVIMQSIMTITAVLPTSGLITECLHPQLIVSSDVLCIYLSPPLSPQSVIQCTAFGWQRMLEYSYINVTIVIFIRCSVSLPPETSVTSTVFTECHPIFSVITYRPIWQRHLMSCHNLLSPPQNSVISTHYFSWERHPMSSVITSCRLLSSVLSVQNVIQCPLSSPPVDLCHLYSQFRMSSNVLWHHLL